MVLQPLLLLHSRFCHHNACRIQRSSYRPSSLKSLSSRGSWDQLRMRDNRASESPRWPLSDIVTKLLSRSLSPRRSLCSRRNLRSSKAGTEPKRSIVPIKNNPHIADLKLMRRIGPMMSHSLSIASIFIRIPCAAPESVTFTPRGALTFFSTVLGLAASSTLGERSRVLFPMSTKHYVA